MSSLKMTFSLASLVILIALIAMPAVAQRDNAGAVVINTGVGDSGQVNPGGFAVLGETADPGVDVDLDDLQKLFRLGVTITLLAPKDVQLNGNPVVAEGATPTPDALKIKNKDVVISEIMWALNTGVAFTAYQDNQWIELYINIPTEFHDMDTTNEVPNPPTDVVDLENWVLHWDTGRDSAYFGDALGTEVEVDTDNDGTNNDDVGTSTDADTDADKYIIVDQVSNLRFGGWNPINDKVGQSGLIDTDEPADSVDLISMYRNIDYTKGRGDAPDGSAKDSWKSSTEYFATNMKGTPSGQHFQGLTIIGATEVKYDSVIINEVGNNEGDAYDWVELRNVTDAAVNIKKWRLSSVTAVGDAADAELVTFPDDNHYTIPAKGVVLIVNSDPYQKDDHPIALGNKWNKGEAREVRAVDTKYYVSDKLKLGTGDYLLVLRSGYDKNKPHEKIKDLTGEKYIPDDAFSTSLWPLKGTKAGHGDVFKDLDDQFAEGKVYHRNKAGVGTAEHTWTKAGYTGIGYKRNALDFPGITSEKISGTPGYPNDAQKSDGTAATDVVMISEIMYATGDRGLTQWVELRNMSDTVGVNVDSWRLNIVNHHEMMDDAGMMVDWDGKYVDSVDLSGRIPPGQSYLIVSRTTGRDTTQLPEDRIAPAKKDRGEPFLNPYGFQLTLIAKRGEAAAKQEGVDMVGNLKPRPEGARRDDAQAFNADVAWNWPSGINEDDERVSIIRISTAADAVMPVTGMDENGWALYTMTAQYAKINDDTYYGHDSDISSPGHHAGGVLPVSLSKFRPERMKDTGAVVVRWITESETNNAGFNILRSDTRDGEFTKLNTKLIAGHGTTSERNTYEYADTSAKPNVIYYYQIQDVSLDGQVQTLRTTHLRGNVTAAGKLTTTWAELKALQ